MDQQLISFVAVAEHKSFTRAAELLGTTQPAVSQNVQNLEKRMNVKLLERSNKFVGLNKAGEVVYHYAKEILHLYAQMDRLVEDMITSASGSLYIGSSLTFGEYILPHALSRFLTKYPGVNPSISIENTREVVDRVASGRFDIGIIEGTYSNDEVQVEEFAEDTVMVVASVNHPLAHQSVVTAEELSRETWLLREQGSGTREITEDVLERFQIHPVNIMELGSIQVIKESVEAGLGIALLSKWVVRKELALGGLTILPLAPNPIHRQFYVVTRISDFQTKSTLLFKEFLHTESHSFMVPPAVQFVQPHPE